MVLGEVGALLVKSSRVVDIVAYHGDAKFDLLLPDTADLGAVVVARRVGSHNSQYPGRAAAGGRGAGHRNRGDASTS